MTAPSFGPVADTRIAGPTRDVALPRKYQEYRRALRGAAISVSADLLSTATVSSWVRRSGVGVHCRSAAQLDATLIRSIPPARITLHCNDDVALTRWAVRAGVGRFVAGSQTQCDTLAEVAPHTPRVMIDLSGIGDPHLPLCVAASQRLELIGVHHLLSTPLSVPAAEETVTAMVACVSCLRRHHGQIATRLSFAGLVPDHHLAPRNLRAHAEQLESLVEDACARYRYPRPGLVILC